MMRCPAATAGYGVLPLWLIFCDLGGGGGGLFAGMVAGILHGRVLLDGHRLDCYCCGVPVCVLVLLIVDCEGTFVYVACGRYWVDEFLLVFILHLIFHHHGLCPYIVIFSLGCFMRRCCWSLVVCFCLDHVRIFGLNRYCVIKETVYILVMGFLL